MDLDLTTAEILTLLQAEGWHVPSPVEAVFDADSVTVRVLDLMYSHVRIEHVRIERLGYDKFKLIPLTYRNKT